MALVEYMIYIHDVQYKRGLISEFHKITGVPVIINTSMNVMGEPIVNTPEQAHQMILKTNMDYIVIGNNLVKK